MVDPVWQIALAAIWFVLLIGGGFVVAEVIRLRHDLDDHLAQGRPAPGRHRGDQ